MPRPSITWVISDTHFFHEAMVTLCNRPSNFNDLIMSNLKHYVKPQDLLIHLGDVIFYQYPVLKSMLDSVPCRKVLTMGNHDRKSKGWYLRNGFDFVCDTFTNNDVMFSHKPMEGATTLNIHGHWHTFDTSLAPDWWKNGKYKLVSIEHHYKPLNLEKI